MKIRSLLLGSLAAAGFATAGYATDLGVMTSLNVCDDLGLSGLTISSDDNCLVITGGVTYEFKFGDYDSTDYAGWDPYRDDYLTEADDNGVYDHNSDVDAWLQFTATASSSFGPASATIKLISNDSSYSVAVDKAFVTIGDTTMLTAGKASSIFKNGDDEPLNFLGLFNSDWVNTGVGAYGYGDAPATGGDVIQLVSDLGNGLWVGGGLEDLSNAGTAVGVISYAGDGLTAHASVALGGILTNPPGDDDNDWLLHAGFTGTFDTIKVVGAIAAGYDDANTASYWNALGSVSATFDMFTLAGSVEATNDGYGNDTWGAGGSVGFTVSDGVTLNLGARYYDPNYYAGDDSVTQVAAQIIAAVSDDVTLTGEIGARSYGPNSYNGSQDIFYAKGKAAWAPGGGVDASVSGEVNSIGAWSTDFKISKSIK